MQVEGRSDLPSDSRLVKFSLRANVSFVANEDILSQEASNKAWMESYQKPKKLD
jgi:hypothetical protein